ncbi:unnamed protein product [Dibothriocephalus latus]|uniref:Cysteine-rich PDZ-binding protein n=1 Tax=Dibothriocephalus latus TaxID=60516 RepID=A0A3P7M8C7_DIBLA|nr:unnamed protein product [Dibothriocephalus latus]
MLHRHILGVKTRITMVCEKCWFICFFIHTHIYRLGEKKLGRIATPDPWKAGARNVVKGGRKLNENKLLSGSKSRFNPYTKSFRKCRICAQSVHQPACHYCQACAFKKGICAMCGVRLVNTTSYNQSSV